MRLQHVRIAQKCREKKHRERERGKEKTAKKINRAAVRNKRRIETQMVVLLSDFAVIDDKLWMQ